MARAMERPAPLLTMIGDGGAMGKQGNRDAEAELAAESRAFCEALIIGQDLTIPDVDAYADKLARLLWQGDRRSRVALFHTMTAYLDGYLAGYDSGYNAGIDEGRAMATENQGAPW